MRISHLSEELRRKREATVHSTSLFNYAGASEEKENGDEETFSRFGSWAARRQRIPTGGRRVPKRRGAPCPAAGTLVIVQAYFLRSGAFEVGHQRQTLAGYEIPFEFEEFVPERSFE